MNERRGGDLIEPARAGTVVVISPHDDHGVVACGGCMLRYDEERVALVRAFDPS